MRAIVFERNGGPEVLEPKDLPDPAAGEGQVVVDVQAIGVNYRDVYERNGADGSKAPAIIGVEGAGTVAETGERVAWSHVSGSYAERVAADRNKLVPVPDGISFEVAAAAILQGMTAHYLASDSYPIEDRDWVLVHAASGGVGAAAHPAREAARRPRDRNDLLRTESRARARDQLWLQRPKPTLRGPRNHARPRVHGSFKASGRAGISGNERLLPASTTCTGFTGLGSGDRSGGRRGGSGTFEGRLAGGRTARAWVETRARNWRFVAESLPAFHHFVVSARESAGCPPVRSA